jgi:hypothetical protein
MFLNEVDHGRLNVHYAGLPMRISKGVVVHSPSAESIHGTEEERFRRWYMIPWTSEKVSHWFFRELGMLMLEQEGYFLAYVLLSELQKPEQNPSQAVVESVRQNHTVKHR